MVSPVEVIWIVPLSATAQLLLPGTEVMAVPVQLIMPLLPRVAVADPVPLICVLPLQVAANVPDTEFTVRLVIVHEKPPHVPCWAVIDCVDANVPVFRLVLSSDVVTAAVVEGVVATLPHAVVTNSAAKDATDKSLERIGGIVACL